MKKTRKILILFFILIVSIFLSSCNRETEKENKNNSLIEGKTNYKVEFFNSNLVSGDDEMYEFYLHTKEGNPLSVNITYFFEKDYYNKKFSTSRPEVDEDIIQEYELVYDGNVYNYYDVSNFRSLLGSYKYLNYSNYENKSIYSTYIYRVGYTISNNPNYTYETYVHALSSSISANLEVLSEIIPVVSFVYSGDLAFTNNKIINIEYFDNGYKYYYSDYSILTTTVLLLNQLSWVKDLESLSGGYDFPTNSKKIIIMMNRTLINDKNGLMLKSLGEDYFLYYTIDLDYGIISMGYSNLSSTSNNLYSKLTNEQIEVFRGIIKEELIRDFTLGEYSYKCNKETSDRSSTIYRVRLVSNNEAEIVKNTYYENGDVFVPIEDVIVSGKYYIDTDKSEKELVISGDGYIYRFRLSYNENKSIKFVSNESTPNTKLFSEITDESIFYYGEKYIYGNILGNQDKVLITRFNSLDNQISDVMASYIKEHKSTYKGDKLWRVRTNYLRFILNIYKYENSCESFIEFDGKIYEMGPSSGGYGVTQLAYYHEKDKYILYYILSYGSDIHRSEVYSFDFQERVIKKVEGINVPTMIDIEFGDVTTGDDGLILSIYESELTPVRFPFWWEGEKKQLLISNILDISN